MAELIDLTFMSVLALAGMASAAATGAVSGMILWIVVTRPTRDNGPATMTVRALGIVVGVVGLGMAIGIMDRTVDYIYPVWSERCLLFCGGG